MKCYVYILRRPDGTPFYVGKGSGNRAKKHVEEAVKGRDYNPHKSRIIRKLLVNGQEPMIEIVRRFDNDDDAYDFEAELIEKIGRRNIGTGPLANMSAGGRGVIGVPLTDEARQKISEAGRRRFQDPAQRRWARENMRKIHADPDAVEKMVSRRTATLNSAEKKQKASATSKRQWADRDARDKLLAAQRAYASSEEARQASRDRMIARREAGFKGHTKAVMVDGVRYETMSDAAAALGLKMKTLSARFSRFKSKGQFPAGWGYLDKAA